MSRRIVFEKGYFPHSPEKKNANIHTDYDVLTPNESTSNADASSLYYANLPADLDITSELPANLLMDKGIMSFLGILGKAILSSDLQNISLSKLHVSEQTENSVVLEWIYNYFRLYFSFDREEGNHYGIIINNKEEGSFYNNISPMKSDQYKEIAKYIVDLVRELIFA